LLLRLITVTRKRKASTPILNNDKKKKPKNTTCKPKIVHLPSEISVSGLQQLIKLQPNIPEQKRVILDKNRQYFKNFFRGIRLDETRDNYNKEVFQAIGVGKCLGELTEINSGENLA